MRQGARREPRRRSPRSCLDAQARAHAGSPRRDSPCRYYSMTRRAPAGDATLDPTRPAPPEVTVRVVTQPSAPAVRRRLPRPGNVISTLVALALAVALFLVVGVVTGLLSIGNPFATTTIDRSPPAVLKQLTNLSTYSAAQGRYEQTIDVEDDVSILPSFLAGEHTVFLAQGSVDAACRLLRIGHGCRAGSRGPRGHGEPVAADARQGRDRHARESRREP